MNVKFSEFLEEFGYSKAEFARLIGVSPETVSRWGEEPPRVVMLYLEERREFQLFREELDNLRSFVDKAFEVYPNIDLDISLGR